MFQRWDLTIRIYQEEDGSYFAEVVNFPWCFTMGKNIEELNTNIKEAIVAYSKSLLIDAENHNFHFSKKDLSLTPK